MTDKFQNKIVEIKPLVKENIYKIKELRKENEKFTILIIGEIVFCKIEKWTK